MSEKKIVVPDGMLKAYLDSFNQIGSSGEDRLEAALRWQSNRSPDISPELLERLANAGNVSEETAYDIVDMALRRMYVAPEPEKHETQTASSQQPCAQIITREGVQIARDQVELEIAKVRLEEARIRLLKFRSENCVE